MNKKILVGLVLFKAAALFLLFYFFPLPLAPDEAQYWTWSRALDWGYYSKPPGVAWQIRLGTSFLGDNELGIRLGSMILSSFLVFAVYLLYKAIFEEEKPACWAACILCFSPVGIYLSMAATTDVGAILFFTLALVYISKKLSSEQSLNYLIIGLLIACGALFKWTAYFMWGYILIGGVFQRKLLDKKLLWGTMLSLLGLIPSLFWNASHDWATFQHVGKTLYQGGQTAAAKGNFFDFLASQAGLAFPLFFVFFIFGFFSVIFKKKNPSLQFLIVISSGLFIYLSLACFKKMQANWAIYLYPAVFCLATSYAFQRLVRPQRWLMIGATISTILISVTMLIPWLQQKAIGPQISYRINPMQQSMGWNRLPELLEKVHFDPQEEFLVADKYQMASILSFYNAPKIRAHFLNISHMRKNQFSYFAGMENEIGKTGLFIIAENKIPEKKLTDWYATHYQKQLSTYFDKVECLGSFPLFESYHQPVKFAMIFRCKNYNGLKPEDPNLY